MTRFIARIDRQAHLRAFLRSHVYLLRMVAVGLIAIGVSGGFCQLVGYRLGDHALAADSQVAQPSPGRCAD